MTKKYLKYVVSIIGKDALFVLLGLFALAFMEGVSLMLIIPFLAIIGMTEQQVTDSPITLQLTELAETLGLSFNLISILLIFIFLITLRELLVKQQTVQTNHIQQKIVNAFRLKLYKALVNSNWLFFTRMRHSDMIQALTQDINRIGLLVLIIIRMISTIVIAAVYLVGALIISFEMTLITLASVMMLLWVGRKKLNVAHHFGEIQTNHHNKMYSLISESLAGIKMAKCFGSENRQIESFNSNIESIYKVQSETNIGRASARFNFGLGVAIILAIFLFISVELLQLPSLSIVILVFLFSRLSPKVSSLQQDLLRLLNALPALNAYDNLLMRTIASNEKSSCTNTLMMPNKFIVLDNVNFSYNSAEDGTVDNTLSDINLRIPIGDRIAIVGPSGSGKSTLADILMGLIFPQSGEFTLDGEKLSQEHLLQWRKHVAYVPQYTYLFNDSVRNNLLWSKPDASEQQLLTALKQANAFHFVMGMPQGLDSPVGDRGYCLSGGERQRLALAQALLLKPLLLILDEATSALDIENQTNIMQTINKLGSKLTVIIITHDLSSLQDVDLIYLMKDGKLELYFSR